jgi:diacylglycerol O-acyltransferase
MERLPGVDAGFLYMETPTLHMHTLKVSVIDVSTVPGGYSFERFQEELAARLHLLPPFRRRLLKVPFQIHHPLWIEDEDFDQRRHVRRLRVPAPGTMREVEQVIGRIASTPLDRSKPLWEIDVLEGMADGHVVVVAKMHHSMADGVAASALLANIMDVSPEPMAPPPIEPWQGEPVPSKWRLMKDALVEWFQQLWTLPALLGKTFLSILALVQVRRASTLRPPRPILDTPKVSFNGAITARRTFATVSLPLADFKRVKERFGVTFNDVVLAVVSGALRGWLAEHGEAPSGPLVAGVPVSTDDPDAIARLGGNRVSNLFTSLCTDLADPVGRLRHISAITKEAKVMQNTLGLDMLENWVQFTPPGPFSAFMRAYSRWNGANLHRAPFNLVVSNVPGPRQPVYVGGARLTDIFSVGPILEGIGLNITVWSYLDRMNFSAIACPDTLPDLRNVVDRLPYALGELVGAADAPEDETERHAATGR